MKVIKLIFSIAITSSLIGFIAGEAHAQRSSKPAPTPTPGSQIESGASRTTPASVMPSTGNTQVNKNNGMGQLKSGTGGSMGDQSAAPITKLRITVVTGGDDLRSNSELRAFLITSVGKRFESIPLNCDNGKLSLCHGIPDGTQRIFVWDVSADCREVGPDPQQQAKGGCLLVPAEIRRFGLLFQSHNGLGQTSDNWNLNKLEVEYVIEGGSKPGTFPMFKASGDPLYRFKSAEEWETDPLKLP